MKLLGFVQLLRAAGMPIGSDRVLLAQAAVGQVGITCRSGLRAALRASLPTQPEQLPLFDAAFDAYWQAPNASLAALLPNLPPLAQLVPRRPPQAGPPRRLLEAITPPHAWKPAELPEIPKTPARMGASSAEADWTQRRFDELGRDEWPLLRRAVRQLARRLQRPQRSRRWQPSNAGARVDLQAALRQLQAGRPLLALPRQRRRPARQTCIWLGDVSGSMQDSTRALLLWAHAQAQTQTQTASPGLHWRFWAFGTRLHALSPLLRSSPDPDAALLRLAEQGLGGPGGTRIGAALQSLLKLESPRLAGGRCTLLLVSDGLEHDAQDPLLPAMLAAWRARGVRLLWLDPLEREHLQASPALAAGADARWPMARLSDLLALSLG